MPIPTLQTERLALRPFTLEDVPDVVRLAGERAIADTTLNIPYPYTPDDAVNFISSHEAAFDAGVSITWAITQRTDGALVGAMGLMGIKPHHQAELGYWVARPHWGRGICSEAGRAVIRFAFLEYGLLRVHACCLSRNPASARVMQKLGMRHEGRRRGHAMKWAALEDLELYGVLKADWQDGALS